MLKEFYHYDPELRSPWNVIIHEVIAASGSITVYVVDRNAVTF
jgi:hypothetical protein